MCVGVVVDYTLLISLEKRKSLLNRFSQFIRAQVGSFKQKKIVKNLVPLSL